MSALFTFAVTGHILATDPSVDPSATPMSDLVATLTGDQVVPGPGAVDTGSGSAEISIDASAYYVDVHTPAFRNASSAMSSSKPASTRFGEVLCGSVQDDPGRAILPSQQGRHASAERLATDDRRG